MKVRDSHLAKFGTKAERSTNLWTHAQRRPAPYEQTTEKKIAKHSNDLKKQKRGEIKIRHRHRDTTSVVSSVNSNVSRALTLRKPARPQPKRRRNTASLNEPSDNATTSEQRIISIVPAPPMPTSQERQESSMPSDPQEQNEGRKQKRPQFYGFTDPDISLTNSLASTSSAKPKKRKTKKKRRKAQRLKIQ